MRVLLYGTGPWAEIHAKALVSIPDVELIGLCGHSNIARLESFADRHKIASRGVVLREMVERLQPEMVDIVVSPVCRLEAVRSSLFKSVKVINIEKPWALLPDDAYEMVRLVKAIGIKLVVNHQKKYLPAWATLGNVVDDGKLGRILHVRGTCRGNPAEQGTHIVDAALKMCGTRSSSWTTGQVGELEGLRNAHSAPNAALASTQLSNGIRVDLAFGSWGWDVAGETETYSKLGLQILGTEGIAELGLSKGLTIKYNDGTSAVDPGGWDSYYLEAQRNHLASAIAYGRGSIKEHDSDVKNALSAFELIMAMYQSALEGGAVNMPIRATNTVVDRMRLRMPLSLAVEGSEALLDNKSSARRPWFPTNILKDVAQV